MHSIAFPQRFEISLRNHYILSYAEYMRSDPTLWRITVEYMCSCGRIGEEMADEVLMRVPLKLESPKNATAASEESARIRAGNLAGVLKEVVATCFDHRRERVRRMVCRVSPLNSCSCKLEDSANHFCIDCCSDLHQGKRVWTCCVILHISRRLAWTRSRR